MGHCPHVMQNQWDKFESYGTFSRIISLLTKFIGYMLQLYPKYLNRCKTSELWCNLHKKKKKNIIFSCNKNLFNIKVIKNNFWKNMQRYTFRIFFHKKKQSGNFVSQWLWHIPFMSNELALFYHMGHPELHRVTAETISGFFFFFFFFFTSKWWDQWSIGPNQMLFKHHNGRPKCVLDMLNGISKDIL